MKRFSVTASVVVCLCVDALVARSETQVRTVYVSAVDKKGMPVADLTAADLRVSEGGRAQASLTVEHATAPMQIALMIDDRGFGLPEVRQGLSTFIEAVTGHAQVGVFSAVRPEATIVDFTADTPTLLDGIQRLVPMQVGGRGLGTLTLELAHAYEKQGTARPVMVAVTIDETCRDVMGASRGAAELDAHLDNDWAARIGIVSGRNACPLTINPASANWPQVVDQVQRSRATFFAITARHRESGDHDPLIDASAGLSGGRVDPVLTDSAIPMALNRIANELLGQYAVSYDASPVPKGGAPLQVDVKRSGVTVRAPERVGVR